MMNDSLINSVIDDFSQLPLEDKEYVIEIIEKQLIDLKRERIARRAEEAITNFKEGSIKKGTVKELYKDLESEGD